MTRSVVALVRARAPHILDDLERVLALAGLDAWVAAHAVASPVTLVAQVSSPFPFPAANTTPWQLEGAIRGLRARGVTNVRCPDEHGVLRAYGVELAGGGAAFLLPTLGCDPQVTIRGATQLATGTPTFALMDGTTCAAARPIVKDVLLASADPVALDAIAATLMGFEPEAIPHLVAAADAGWGTVRRADIDVVGDHAIAAQRWGFTLGGGAGGLAERVRERASGGLAELLARGAEAYREVRWPLRDRAVFDAWRDATAWGAMFDRYEALGTLAAPVPAPGLTG